MPPESCERLGAGAAAALTDGPGGGGEVPRQRVLATVDPGGGGVIPKDFCATPTPVYLGGGDGVGSLPSRAAGLHASHALLGGNGTGGIRAITPHASLPGSLPSPMTKPIAGLVIDASTQLPIAGELMVVLDSRVGIAGLAITDDSGFFIATVSDVPGLELALPAQGIAGISIEPGDVLTIFVP